MLTFPSKDYNEKTTLEFSYLDELTVENISSATMTIDVYSGWDDHPGRLLVGAPVIQGPVILQQIQGGEPGTIYRLTCTVVISDERILVTPAYLPVSGYRSLYSEDYLTPQG